MTQDEWETEVLAAIAGTDWTISVASARSDSMIVYAHLAQVSTDSSVRVRLRLFDFPSRGLRRAEILRHIQV